MSLMKFFNNQGGAKPTKKVIPVKKPKAVKPQVIQKPADTKPTEIEKPVVKPIHTPIEPKTEAAPEKKKSSYVSKAEREKRAYEKRKLERAQIRMADAPIKVAPYESRTIKTHCIECNSIVFLARKKPLDPTGSVVFEYICPKCRPKPEVQEEERGWWEDCDGKFLSGCKNNYNKYKKVS